MKNAILFGATSEIGAAIIEEFCDSRDWKVIRAGSEKFTETKDSKIDLPIDWEKLETIEAKSYSCFSDVKFDFVVVSLGYLPETSLQYTSAEVLKSASANLLWPLLCLEFLERNSLLHEETVVVVVSSSLVALPATRKSLLYTIFKSTLEEVLVDGMRYGFISNNIILLRPGYVLTKINSHLSPGKFPTTSKTIAMTLKRKIRNGRVSGVVYAPSRIGTLAFLARILPIRIRRWCLEKLQNTN